MISAVNDVASNRKKDKKTSFLENQNINTTHNKTYKQ